MTTVIGSVGRAYALCDAETSKVVSAKNPRKWPDMFRYSAAYANSPEPGAEMPAIRVILPDGATMLSSSADFVPSLSAKMSRPVKLLATPPCAPQLEEHWTDREEQGGGEVVTDEATPEGAFFDLAVRHVLTTATLDSLRASNSRSRFELRRFRPNLMIDTNGGKGFIENDWVGKVIAIGPEARILGAS